MSEEFADIKIRIKKGKINVSLDGTRKSIVLGLSQMLLQDKEMLDVFKLALIIVQLQTEK